MIAESKRQHPVGYNGPMLEFGQFRLDPDDERLWKADKLVAVRRKPFAILKYLAQNPHRLVTHEDLLANVWGGAVVSESSVRTHLHELRQLLGDGVIETVIGRGYRFVAMLATAAPAPEPEPASTLPAVAIVGRDGELAILRAAFERVGGGHRQLCFVTGDPGIGKTALVDAFVDEVVRGGGIVVRGQCVEQHGTPDAYLAVVEMLGRLRHGKHGDAALAALVRYAPMFLAQVPHLVPDAQLAEVMRRAVGGTESRMVRELIEALEAIAVTTPLVVVIENLQWSDIATIDLLAMLGQRRERAKLMVIATSRRAEAQTVTHPLNRVMRPLVARSHALAVPLDRLELADIRKLVDQRFPGHGFPASFVDAVDTITAGTPLFVTSLLDDLDARGMIAHRDGWQLTISIEELATHRPDSLKQLIDIQLDRLTPQEQRLLEAASVAGAEAPIALIAAALEDSEEHVDELCDALVRRSLFLRRGEGGELPDGTLPARYAIVHGLVAEVCADRCAPARRQRWHRLMGERLEAMYGERAADVAHALATHFDKGAVPARALGHYIVAAERTARRFAPYDTLILFRRATELSNRTSAGPERDAIELRILQGMSSTILRITEPAEDPLAMFQRMVELATRLADHQALYAALVNLSIRHATLAEYTRADELIAEADALAASQMSASPDANLDARLREFRDMAHVLVLIWRGEVSRALALLDAMIAVPIPPGDFRLGILGPPDRRTVLIAYSSMLRWIVGEPDEAMRIAERANALARDTNDPYTLGLTYCNIARLHLLLGAPADRVREPADVVLAVPQAEIWHPQARLLLAWADACDGTLGAAMVPELVRAYHERAARFRMGASHLALPVIEALVVAGHTRDGLALADEVLALARARGEHVLAPELQRLRSRCLALTDREAAVTACREAIAGAAAMGAHMLELRAAIQLATLGPDAAALACVRAACARVTGGTATGDLVAARRLLDP